MKKLGEINFQGTSYIVYDGEPNFGELACIWSKNRPNPSVFTYDEDCAAASDQHDFKLCTEDSNTKCENLLTEEGSAVLAVRAIVEEHTKKLNIMKDNLSRWDEERWTDTEIRECENMIKTLASILSDLNRVLPKL